MSHANANGNAHANGANANANANGNANGNASADASAVYPSSLVALAQAIPCAYDPMVLPMLLDYAHRYTSDLVRESDAFRAYRGGTEIQVRDVTLALESTVASTTDPSSSLSSTSSTFVRGGGVASTNGANASRTVDGRKGVSGASASGVAGSSASSSSSSSASAGSASSTSGAGIAGNSSSSLSGTSTTTTSSTFLSQNTPPPNELLSTLARHVNKDPLPDIPRDRTLLLPHARYCLLNDELAVDTRLGRAGTSYM